jgi:hypothetical protein
VGAYQNYTQQYDWYYGLYRSRQDLPTDVTIEVGGVPVSGQTYEVSALVSVESGGLSRALRIYMVQVLDRWPTSPVNQRNTFKQAADTEDATIRPGESLLVQRQFTFDSTSWANQGDIKIIVWAQGQAVHSPAEVYQAESMGWPFRPLILADGDYDGDGDVDLDDYVEYYNCAGGPDPGAPPSQACLDAFDLDASATIDLADFGVFTVLFTGAL